MQRIVFCWKVTVFSVQQANDEQCAGRGEEGCDQWGGGDGVL
jgi:hypothetical protein